MRRQALSILASHNNDFLSEDFEVMDIANLTAKYEDYESNIGSMLELVDVYKDTSQKSK